MKISIIIPCYNEEKFIPDCLNSLIKQSRLADEIIICDNNSTDNSIKVSKQYQQKLPIKIIKQPIQGIMPTVEKAWRTCTGDIIIRTDADAVFPKNWLKNIEAHFVKDPDLAACGGEWVPYKETVFWTVLTKLSIKAGDYILPLTRGYKFLLGPNTALRRQTLIKINGYITDDPKITDDQLISLKLSTQKLKYRRFDDCWNYHSSRQFHKGFGHLAIYTLSAIFPSLYPQKTI